MAVLGNFILKVPYENQLVIRKSAVSFGTCPVLFTELGIKVVNAEKNVPLTALFFLQLLFLLMVFGIWVSLLLFL